MLKDKLLNGNRLKLLLLPKIGFILCMLYNTLIGTYAVKVLQYI